MKKIWIFLTLFFAFATYSSWIYTGATDYGTVMTTRQQLGKKIYQEYNCQSCHQIFGLGGYLGPENRFSSAAERPCPYLYPGRGMGKRGSSGKTGFRRL